MLQTAYDRFYDKIKMKIGKTTNIQPEALGVNDAARFIGLAPKTLRNRLGRKAENPFPVQPKRNGRKIVFMVADLKAYLESLPYETYE